MTLRKHEQTKSDLNRWGNTTSCWQPVCNRFIRGLSADYTRDDGPTPVRLCKHFHARHVSCPGTTRHATTCQLMQCSRTCLAWKEITDINRSSVYRGNQFLRVDQWSSGIARCDKYKIRCSWIARYVRVAGRSRSSDLSAKCKIRLKIQTRGEMRGPGKGSEVRGGRKSRSFDQEGRPWRREFFVLRGRKNHKPVPHLRRSLLTIFEEYPPSSIRSSINHQGRRSNTEGRGRGVCNLRRRRS